MAFLVFPRVLDAYRLSRIEKMFEMTEAYGRKKIIDVSTLGKKKVRGREIKG